MIFPNPITFAGALVRVAWAFIRGKKVFVPLDVELDRLAGCRRCPFLDSAEGQCLVCSCFVELKAPIATEQCPKGRWLRYWGR